MEADLLAKIAIIFAVLAIPFTFVLVLVQNRSLAAAVRVLDAANNNPTQIEAVKAAAAGLPQWAFELFAQLMTAGGALSGANPELQALFKELLEMAKKADHIPDELQNLLRAAQAAGARAPLRVAAASAGPVIPSAPGSAHPLGYVEGAASPKAEG
jgi:hypothetical protein